MKHPIIYKVWYYLWVQTPTGNLGSYPSWIRGDCCPVQTGLLKIGGHPPGSVPDVSTYLDTTHWITEWVLAYTNWTPMHYFTRKQIYILWNVKKNAVFKKGRPCYFRLSSMTPRTQIYSPHLGKHFSSTLHRQTAQGGAQETCNHMCMMRADFFMGVAFSMHPGELCIFFLTLISKLKGLQSFRWACQRVRHIPEAMLSPFILGDWQGGHPRWSKELTRKCRSMRSTGSCGEFHVSSINGWRLACVWERNRLRMVILWNPNE